MRKGIKNSQIIGWKLTFAIMIALLSFKAAAQDRIDSLKEKIEIHEGKLDALDEKTATMESDLSKLTKLKISGYIQAQFDDYQSDLVKANEASNTFYIRRARVKFTYKALNGLKFVLQPDFSTGNLSIKDAYAVANFQKIPGLTFTMGQFNRPNYEVEYSSGQRELLERSKVIRTIYPGEREIGAKVEYQPLEIPLKVQVALVNGNFTGKEAKDADSRKDIIARAVYSFKFPSSGIGIDLGAHLYYGALLSKTKYVSNFEGQMDSTATNFGTYFDRKWGGAELQFYFDILGGLSLKGEYIQGKNAYAGDSKTNPFKTRNFSGYYAYFIKNIGKKHQFVLRYDNVDPNTNLSGQSAGSEVIYNTLTVAWQYYMDDNIRISLNYEMPKNQTSSTVQNDLKDNVLGIRLQAKF